MNTIDRINTNVLKNVMELYDIELGFSLLSKHHLKFNGIPLPHTIGYNLDFIIGYVEGFARCALMNKMDVLKKSERTTVNTFNGLSTIGKAQYLIKVYTSFIDILGGENIPDQYMYDIKDSISILSMYDGDDGDTKNISFYVNEVNKIAKDLNLDWLIHLELKDDSYVMNEEFSRELVEDVFCHDCTLVTNFDEDLRYLYEEAIKRYGSNQLYICNNAYDSLGRPIDGCLALHYTGEDNLTEFWDIYKQICEEEMGT